MNTTFWGQWSEDYLKDHPELPPLTDEMLAAFKKRSGLELPSALVNLLRTKNGGRVYNPDFKLNGQDYCVSEIVGLGMTEDFSSIRSYAFMLLREDCAELRERLARKVGGDLAKVLLVADSGGYPDAYALNFNHCNSAGEPTVYRIAMDGDEVDADLIADSFADFLKGHYLGETEPIARMDEADQYRLLAQGGYSGRHKVGDSKVEMTWKICQDGDCILVFQEEDWGWGKSVTRMEMNRSQLCESSGVVNFLFGLYQQFLLYRTGKEIGANLSQAVNTKKLRIAKEDAPLKPRCFNLTFHTHTLEDELSADSWIRVRTAKAFEDRWKNSESQVWNDSIYSASEADLKQARRAIVRMLG